MALHKVDIPRTGWRWRGARNEEDNVLELIDPAGAHRGTWWPEGELVPLMFQHLGNLAVNLNELDTECRFCMEPGVDVCPACTAEHREPR